MEPSERYRRADTLGDTLLALICGDCGAVVANDERERHDAWHGAVLSREQLADVLEGVSRRSREQRYGPASTAE